MKNEDFPFKNFSLGGPTKCRVKSPGMRSVSPQSSVSNADKQNSNLIPLSLFENDDSSNERLDIKDPKELRKIMEKIGDFGNGVYTSKNMGYLQTEKAKVIADKDGQISITGLSFKLPDIGARDKRNLEKAFNSFKEIIDSDKSAMLSATKATQNTVMGIGIVVLLAVLMMVGFYFFTRGWNSNN